MLSVYICEDNPKQLDMLTHFVQSYIMIEELDMEVTLATKDPHELWTYIKEKDAYYGIFFLDIDLRTSIDGIFLGSKIRQKDRNCKLVFLTTHDEKMPLTFKYKLEALDYISKDDRSIIRDRVRSALIETQNFYTTSQSKDTEILPFKVGNQSRFLPIDQVIYLETSTAKHRLILHHEEGQLEIYGNLTDIEKLSNNFIRVHHAFLVNKKHVLRLDKSTREIMMTNGLTAFGSVRLIKNLF